MTNALPNIKTENLPLSSQALLWPYQVSLHMLQASLKWQKSFWTLAGQSGVLGAPSLKSVAEIVQSSPLVEREAPSKAVWLNAALPEDTAPIFNPEPELSLKLNQELEKAPAPEPTTELIHEPTHEPRPLAKSLAISAVSPEPLKSPRSRNRGRRS